MGGEVERRRPGDRDRRVGGGHRVVALRRRYQGERHSGPVQAFDERPQPLRSERHHESHRGMHDGDALRRLDLEREVRFHLGAAAPREQSDERSLAESLAQRRAQRVVARTCRKVFEERVADVLRRRAAIAEQRLLEREDAEHAVHIARQLPQPPRGPRPDLRRDVLDERYATLARRAGEAEVQPGVVDADDDVGRVLLETHEQIAIEREELRRAPHHRPHPHHGVADEVEGEMDARRRHARSAESLEPR